ncbi:MAG: xanthine dehydrogenase family protein subunit M [Pseudomonadota bacterium]
MSRAVVLPETMDGLWDALDRTPGARIYAGGTDLLVALRAGAIDPPALICLERLAALQGIRDDGDHIRIGAATPLALILEDPRINRDLPVLAAAVGGLGSPLIRRIGTLGGNICTASPAGDTLPPLTVLGAVVELSTRHGARRMPLSDFITGPGSTALAPDELLAAVHIPKPTAFTLQHFEKVGRRSALACAVASMAALVGFGDDDRVASVRLAWGSVGPTVVTAPAAESILTGARLDAAVLTQAAEAVRAAVSPIDDVRAGAGYRRQVAGNLLLRLAGKGARRG